MTPHCEEITRHALPWQPAPVLRKSRSTLPRALVNMAGQAYGIAAHRPLSDDCQAPGDAGWQGIRAPLENTGPRRFLVIEQDKEQLTNRRQSCCTSLNGGRWRLPSHSGSKSLHGWLFCQGQSEERLQEFMRYAVTLGADRAMWTRSQFVRMPDGTRDNGNRQTVYFFNPEIVK